MLKTQEKFLKNLKFIPQVTLLSIPKDFFKSGIDFLLKKIVCQESTCSDDHLCNNCQKLKDNTYFDLHYYQFTKSNIMKKQDVTDIINVLSYQSIEGNNPKICVIEEIEYSSLEASNAFLKFLENLPNNTFLIFTSANSDKILPTIKSRSQIIDLFTISSNFNFEENNLILIKDLINKFIINDNNKEFNNNFLLIKELLNLKDQIGLFFQFLLLLAQNKIMEDSRLNQEVKAILTNWKNNNQLFLINFIEVMIETINKYNNTKNLNLNLLLNHFFITIYQGQAYGY